MGEVVGYGVGLVGAMGLHHWVTGDSWPETATKAVLFSVGPVLAGMWAMRVRERE
ncbi:hypothetical protein [Streptomyces sp. NPDC048172]|uniref:hypothetical protein n=1 Tax=Streptomyces sp. NPDC048172 TaxID=3365505 RepID=UPI00371B4892